MSNGGSTREMIRVLIDPCLEAILITFNLARKLNYKLQHTKIGITGVAGSVMDSAHYQTDAYFVDPTTGHSRKISAFVLRKIDIVTPSGKPRFRLAESNRNRHLADPLFDRLRKVDAVFGADVYRSIVRTGLKHWGPLLAQNTIFGWTVTGTVAGTPKDSVSMNATRITSMIPEADLCYEKLLGLVQRFWAIEEIPQVKRLSAGDVECEKIYSTGVTRDANGRYIVPLLVNQEKVDFLGESLTQARIALASTHRRMQKDSELNDSYCQFMKEYEQLGHMRLLTERELKKHTGPVYYIPHHGIWQRSDNGKKLRVVFNASRPTSTGYSLNDVLYAGEKLQSEIAAVLTLWRRYKYAFCTDIKMMFRQIKINPRDIHLLRILWSPSPNIPARHYVLLTVTYRTVSAPHLALRTLKQLCTDEGTRFPQAVKAVERNLYMDDFLSGSHDLESVITLRDQLIGLLTAGGFSLKKWVDNDPAILADIPIDDRLRPSWLNFSSEGPVNELGVAWDPVSDQFKFRQPSVKLDMLFTKRNSLAELARIFDPTGWLAPLTLIGKMIIQDLWRAKLEWDENMPRLWIDKWLTFRESMNKTSDIAVPRWLGCTPTTSIQLHAFPDASRRAMAGTLYSRVETDDRNVITRLVCAKTKLNSIKGLMPSSKSSRMTIPRLELRAARIAAEILKSISILLNIPMSECHLWTDSEIVRYWLQSDGPVGNDLVDNYIAHIQELIAGATIHHISTDRNPADIGSRGADARKLIEHLLWWNGPECLSKPKEDWPVLSAENSSVPSENGEQPAIQCLLTQSINQLPRDHIVNFSTLNALLRGTARVLRWIYKKIGLTTPRCLAPVTTKELRHAYLVCVRISQRQSFASEIDQLQPGKDGKRRILQGQSALKTLEPFLDSEGTLGVGGRLDHSTLPYDERHPVLLDGQSHLAQLVLRWAHDRSLHGGFRATYARVIQKAWITGGKTRVKRYLRQCLICARISARVAVQGMAPLPAVRVTTPSKPFSKSGVDYAGPFSLCRAKGRGMSTFKGYVAVFICMCTKAVHLELVGDLTTASFLGALTRFNDIRGPIHEIWSENGTNFRGANLELQRLLKEAELDWGYVEGELAKEGITWHFIPPGAPHFGGLWEAGVKSMKAHLQRVIGPRRLTFEEFSTLLTSIGRFLNSRPVVSVVRYPDRSWTYHAATA